MSEEQLEQCASTLVDLIEQCKDAYQEALLSDALECVDQTINQLKG